MGRFIDNSVAGSFHSRAVGSDEAASRRGQRRRTAVRQTVREGCCAFLHVLDALGRPRLQYEMGVRMNHGAHTRPSGVLSDDDIDHDEVVEDQR